MTTQPTNHAEEAEAALHDVASRAPAGDAQTIALLAIGHWLGALHELLDDALEQLLSERFERTPLVAHEDADTIERRYGLAHIDDHTAGIHDYVPAHAQPIDTRTHPDGRHHPGPGAE